MEMRGVDISHLEQSIRRFFQLKPPTHELPWVPPLSDELPWTSLEYESSSIFGDEPRVLPHTGVSKPHQPLPAHSTLPPQKEDHNSTEATTG